MELEDLQELLDDFQDRRKTTRPSAARTKPENTSSSTRESINPRAITDALKAEEDWRAARRIVSNQEKLERVGFVLQPTSIISATGRGTWAS